MDDFELLQAYATRKAEDAFSTLTSRYINLVYSAAARQTSNSQAAEDVTQAVFLTLGRINSLEEVARFVAFLATTENISGQLFQLDSRIASWT